MNKTPLYEMHKQLGAKMVDFGGWEMPVSYSGILKEHQAVRTQAGLFDVSHMGEIWVEGPDAEKYLQYLTCNDLSQAEDGQCQYNILMNEKGGAVDDIIVNKIDSHTFLVCVNASNTQKDWDWFQKYAAHFKVKIASKSEDYALIALQGPRAEKILQNFVSEDLSKLKTFHFRPDVIASPSERGNSPSALGGSFKAKVLISRTGYTGEDGFEIYCSPSEASFIWQKLLEYGTPLGLLPCGLGARDTLRLEMAYPLYGHELSDEIGPLEADLGWVVKINKGNFIGKEALLGKKEKGIEQKRVGLLMIDKAIARADYPLFWGEEKVGWMASGTYSPSLDKNIGCGYVRSDLARIGNSISVEIRGKKKLARIVSTPFYKK